MSNNKTVTVETVAMTVTARLGQFSDSKMFWVDGSVDVRQPCVMEPRMPTEVVQPLIFIPLTFQGQGRIIIPDLGPAPYDASRAPRALRLVPGAPLYDFTEPTLNRSFVPFVAVQTMANWFGGRLPKAMLPFTADTIDKSLQAPILNASLMHMLALQVDKYEDPMRSLAFESLAIQMVTLFLHELCGADAQYSSVTSNEVRCAKEAHERLLQNLQLPPTTTELAETAGMSERRLDHVFQELFGASIFRTLGNARLDHAYQALQTSQISVKELSFRLGYKHASSFSRAFYLRFGKYPAQIRAV